MASGWLEKKMLYPFDPTVVSPARAGEPRLQFLNFSRPDGVSLVLWLAIPSANKPTILYFHGNAGNLALRHQRFSRFLDQGYGLVAMAYRDSSGSTGRPSQTAIQMDAAALYKALPQFIGDGPVVLYGESLGSAVAISLSANPVTRQSAGNTAPAAMILEAPFTSIADVGAHLYPNATAAFRLLRDTWQSQDRIGESDIPLLLLHGSNDNLVPLSQGQEIFRRAGARDKTFYEVRGAGHTNGWQPDAQRVLFDFLDRF